MATGNLTVTLKTLGEFRNGVNFSKDKKGEGLGLINVKDIFSDIPVIDYDTLDKVNLSNQKGIENYFVREGDLFFVRSSVKRDGVGLVSVAKASSNQVIHCGFVIRFRITNKNVHPRFLTYLLRSPHYREVIIGASGGAAITNISQEVLGDIAISLPPLPIQRKIAAILSAYDELIENNTRRIKILEEMAQAIYREWFVKFRFPGHESVRLVDSGTELGLVPEGWEVRKLGDVVELAYGKGLKTEDRIEGNIPVYGSSGVVGYHNEPLVDGPGIIVGRKGNVGSVFWSETGFFPIDTTYYVRTELSLHYVFYNLRQQNFINNDAAVPGLSRNQAYLLPFLVPPNELIARFEDINTLLFARIRNLRSTNTNLYTTRDLLLPRLVSGELDVSELEVAGVSAEAESTNL